MDIHNILNLRKNNKKIMPSGVQDNLYSAKGTHNLPERVLASVDHARLNFKNINPPFPELPMSKMKMYYWICYGFDELCRRTGERVEFTVQTSPSGGISVNAWCMEGESVQEHLPKLVAAMEAGDFKGIADHKYFPNNYFTRADPVREEKHRENKRKKL